MEDKQLEDALAESIEKSFNDSELEDIMNEIENLEKEFSSDASDKEISLSLQKAKDNDLQRVIDAEVESIATSVDEVEMATDETFEEHSDDIEEISASAEDDFEDAFEDETEEISASAEDEFDADDFAEMESENDEVSAIDDSYEESEELIAQDIADIEAAVDEMEEVENNVVALTSKTATTNTNNSDAGIDFNATGSMDLSINFKIAGQTAHLKVENGGLVVNLNGVQLTIDETNGCSVKMAGGVQFSVPLNPTATSKKDVA